MPNMAKQSRLLLASAIAVPALVFVTAATWNRNEVLRDSTSTVERTAAVMHEHAAKVFDTAELILAHVDEHTRSMSRDQIVGPQTNAFLARAIASLDQVVSVWITDADGVVQAGSQPWSKDVRLSDRPFFQAHVNNPAEETQIGSWFVGRATGIPSFAMSRRRTSPDGSFNGVIHVSLSPEYFQRFYQDVIPPTTFAAVLARSDGAVLAREPQVPAGQTVVFSPGNPLRAAMGRGQSMGTVVTASASDGEEIILAFRQIGSRPAYVAYAAKTDALLGRWRRNLLTYGAVALAASLVLVLVSLFTLRRMRAERAALQFAAEEGQRRLAMEERLKQTQKMEALGQLAGGVAHDFNNAAAVVLAGLTLLEKRHARLLDEGGAEVRRLIAGISEGAERGAMVTRRLLTFSRRDELHAEDVDLARFVDDLEAVLMISLPPGMSIRAKVEGTTPHAHVDPGQLRTVLINLVINARDAMPAGGTISLGAEPGGAVVGEADEDRPPTAPFVRIFVSDTGTGMNQETLKRAAEPFFTTKPSGQGTGLGLSMAHGFAAQSGGSMRIESEPGQGTTVSLWLPASRNAATPPKPPGDQRQRRVHRGVE
ncbi:hybrid sensor histidine kinase/response regulator [Teichococcus vastitatis]|uniref:histidine kinase n=1 Tax=Teichococcus vastitatis TaxID=2307076 RepID=A0ABS9WCI9_9PROT|nr:hybrid sensor histidine kinase/response regulator [Pseudoroseomonas vastitatis]MCI0757021.1 ATP-binding protein [Pseudoroseomonas vastitatis]